MPTFHFRQSRIEAHVILCMLSLCVLRMLEQQVKPLGLTYKSALDEISSTKAAILELGDQTFIAPPKYRPAMQQILRSMELSDKCFWGPTASYGYQGFYQDSAKYDKSR